LVSQALSIGIGKRELLEDYYPDELEHIFGEYSAIHGTDDEVEEEHVGALEFLGAGG